MDASQIDSFLSSRKAVHRGFVQGACYSRSIVPRPPISEGVAPSFRIFQGLVSAQRELGLARIGGWHSELRASESSDQLRMTRSCATGVAK